MSSPPPRGVVLCAGARALEERLIADLRELVLAARVEPALLARPVRVLVSSRALRDALAARIAERLGPAVLGVSVQTLWAAAHEILQRAEGSAAGAPRAERSDQGPRAEGSAAGAPRAERSDQGPRAEGSAAGAPRAGRAPGAPYDDELLLELLVRREAAREPSLRQALRGLERGYALCSPSVSDLLSAGLCAEKGAAIEARLAENGHPPERERARAILRVALRCERALEDAGATRPGELVLEASRCLGADGEALLPSRAVLIHGFADATGLVLSFFVALARAVPVRVYLDAPPDPAAVEGGAVTYALRLGERLEAEGVCSAPLEPLVGTDAAFRRPDCFDAVGAEGELREVAYRIRELLDRGARPETIAVVARDLSPYLVPLRRIFGGLGIPFSGPLLPSGLLPARRRLEAVLDLLRHRERVPLERWLEAACLDEDDGDPSDLRLALRAAGVARLSEVAALELESLLERDGDLTLPARRGLEGGEADPASDRPLHAPHRRLAGALVQKALARARGLEAALRRWPARASLAQHLTQLRELLASELGWRAGRVGAITLDWGGWLKALEAMLPAALELDRDELLLALEHHADELQREPLGGAGSGVQVLEVTLARGQCFAELFLLGLNRDVFPRQVREDPLFPDALRRPCLEELPDLPLKRRGALEERFLFAELLSSGERVTISWQRADEDGRPRSPSPLLERLRHAAPGLLEDVPHLPRLWERVLRPPCSGTAARPRTARDLLRLAALAAPRALFAELYPLALKEGATHYPGLARLPALALVELARARLRVLEELDPDLRTLDGRARMAMVSPYLGLIAPSLESGRPAPLYVTTLESLARCPWRTLLERLLRLEPAPDPLAELPGIGALPVGNVVHAALARLLSPSLPPERSLEGALARGPAPVTAPDPRLLARAVERAAEAVAREAGIAWPALRRALAARALPYVARAIELDLGTAPGSRLAVLGAELSGSFAEGARRLAFRADRADRLDDGRLRFSDYKTGAPLTRAVGGETRLRRLRQAVARGEALQVVAYLRGAIELGARARGRYLYLDPTLGPELSELALEESDPALDVLPRTVALLLSAWEQGVFFPRLEDPSGKEPRACERCALAEACVRGDSGMRRRLRELVASAGEERRRGAELARPLETLLALYQLPFAEPDLPAASIQTGRSEEGGR